MTTNNDFDLQAQPFKQWLRHRLMQAKRDGIDTFAKQVLEDTRIPLRGSLSMYRAQLKAKGYMPQDLTVFRQAWEEMKQS